MNPLKIINDIFAGHLVELQGIKTIQGKCKCSTLITKIERENLKPIYFYTKEGYDGWSIFRCKNCRKVISNRWSEL